MNRAWRGSPAVARGEGRRVPAELVRDRETRQAVLKDSDEAEVLIVECVQRAVESTAERFQQPDIVQPSVAGRRETSELTEDALARGLRDERGRVAKQLLGVLVHAELELVLEPHCTKEAERVVDEYRVRDGPYAARLQIALPVVRITHISRSDAHGDRVEREVARRDIGLDARGQRREVDRLIGVGRRHAPGTVTLRERKRRAAEPSCIAKGSLPRLAAGDVEIEHRATEKLVANGAADDPCFLVAEDLADSLIHP
jgi:hypothetical protein